MAKIFKPLLIINLAIVLFMFFGTPLMAENEITVEKPSSFQIGATLYRFDYKEDLIAPDKSTEYGWLPGVYVDYTYKKKSTIYAKIFLSYAINDITYDGSASDGLTTWPVKYDEQKAKMFKFETNIGYAIPIGKSFLLIPYLGYGFQYWERGNNQYLAEFNTVFCEEDYRWHYIPVGIKADYNITNKLNIAASAQANFMVYGEMRAYLSYFGYFDTDFILGNRIGAYAEIPITYKFTDAVGIVLTPWYEYSAIGKSDWEMIGYGDAAYEPASRTHKYGANIGFVFSF
jgi:hypothetical protein